MSLLTPDSGLLFWMVIVFGIVFVILAKYGFPVITRMVDERKQYIVKSLLAAREANEQLANIKARFNTMLKRRSCITGITYSISLNINTMQHTHALTSTPNTDHPVLMRLPI